MSSMCVALVLVERPTGTAFACLFRAHPAVSAESGASRFLTCGAK